MKTNDVTFVTFVTFVMVATATMSYGFRPLRLFDRMNENRIQTPHLSLLPQRGKVSIGSWLQQHQQDIAGWIQGPEMVAAVTQVLDTPQLEALVKCLEADDAVSSGTWERLQSFANVSTSDGHSLARQSTSGSGGGGGTGLGTNLADLLQDLLQRIGLDRIADRIMNFIESNVDWRRITRYIDGPALNRILDTILNLPIFTVFQQNLQSERLSNLRTMAVNFKQRIGDQMSDQNIDQSTKSMCQIP